MRRRRGAGLSPRPGPQPSARQPLAPRKQRSAAGREPCLRADPSSDRVPTAADQSDVAGEALEAGGRLVAWLMWSARGVATHAGVLSWSAARAPQRARATSTGFFDLVYDSKRRFDLQQPQHEELDTHHKSLGTQHDLQRPLKTSLQYKETIGFPPARPISKNVLHRPINPICSA